MAGTILINEAGGVAFNSIGYDQVIAAIRAEFSDRDADLQATVYEGNDLACMSFISVVDQDVSGFRIFEGAVSAAYEKAVREGRTFAEWDELMAKLAADPRSSR